MIDLQGRERDGDWIQTFRGGEFYPMDPRADEVFIEDIAHALANQGRFAGHALSFYSVGEHSVRASYIGSDDEALWRLLHDASETYLVDLPRPVKRFSAIGEHYVVAERRVQAAICGRFGLSFEEPPSVKVADVTEMRDLMAPPPRPWRESGVRPLVEVIVPWSPSEAERRFLDRFRELRQ